MFVDVQYSLDYVDILYNLIYSTNNMALNVAKINCTRYVQLCLFVFFYRTWKQLKISATFFKYRVQGK